MKKALLSPIALVCLMTMTGIFGTTMDCKAAPTSDEKAVAQVVKDLYGYLNNIRQYYMETPESEIEDITWRTPDEKFATQEWCAVRRMAEETAKENENGGVFDFGDKGPLDPWQYDCFEGALTVENIKVTMLPDGEAIADFNIKDATTIGSIPMRWQLCREDGEWRVKDVVFVKDDNYDLLDAMKQLLRDNDDVAIVGVPREVPVVQPEQECESGGDLDQSVEEDIVNMVEKYLRKSYKGGKTPLKMEVVKINFLSDDRAQVKVRVQNPKTRQQEEKVVPIRFKKDKWVVDK